MVQAFVLAGLTATGTITAWQVILLSAFLGTVNAFDMTVRQAFLTEMVERREDLANAIALNSSLVNGARLLGPSLGGLLIAWLGETMCFLFNGLSFLAVLAALLAMRLPPRSQPLARGRVWHGLSEGLGYALGFPPIRAILLLLALVSLAGMSYEVLMPVFARDFLGGGPETQGLLLGAAGVGALVGALYLASRKTILGLGWRLAVAPGVYGACLIGFSSSRWLVLSLGLLVVMGFSVMVQLAASNTILQTIAQEDKRGRVMSLYTMAFIGVAPWGSLLMGWLATRLGPSETVMLGGVACISGSLLFLSQLGVLRRLVRPIYRQMGILPELAAGIQSASDLRVPPEP
jgi:MFS family permease